MKYENNATHNRKVINNISFPFHRLNIFVLLLLSALLICHTASATELHVGPGQTFSTIQSAVDAALSGDIIIVHAGEYTENVDINKRLTLQGEGADLVTVTTSNLSDHIIDVSVDRVNISGFRVEGLFDYHSAGIFLGKGVDHCHIFYNTAMNYYYDFNLTNSSALTNYTPSNFSHGICLYNSSNNTLMNNRLLNSYDSIGLWHSNNNIITNNIISNNSHGIFMYNSNYNTLTNNTIFNNEYNTCLSYSSHNTITDNNASISLNGIFISNSSNHNKITNNTASNNTRGIFIFNSNYNMLTNNNIVINECGTYLCNSSYNTITDNNASISLYGIFLFNSSHHNRITNNTASNNTYNIYLYNSNNNVLMKNNAPNSYEAINLNNSNDNILINNNASIGLRGMVLCNLSENNTLTNNIAMYCTNGIYLKNSNDNVLMNNSASINEYGIYLNSSRNNTIYNNFLNNYNNAYDDSLNIWNCTPTAGINIIGGSWLGGNYWSDYSGSDSNGDGLGDSQYSIAGGSSIDGYPLMFPGDNTATETVSIGSVTMDVNDTIILPITIANTENIRQVTLNLIYDPGIVSILNITANDVISSSTINYTNDIGSAAIELINPDMITVTNATPIINITFQALENTNTTAITMQNVELTNDIVSYTSDMVVNGSITVCISE